MSLAEKRKVSVEEYLKAERNSSEKHIFYDGEIFAMSGASYRHNLISSRLLVTLGTLLKQSTCQALGSDQRVSPRAHARFFYPDVTVVCGNPQFVTTDPDALANPKVIFEVLSGSSEAFDRGAKFAAYREFDSLKHYVLVDQNQAQIEIFTRQSNNVWELSVFDENSEASLPAIDVKFRVAELYAGVFDNDGHI